MNVAEALKQKLASEKHTTKPTRWCGFSQGYQYSDRFKGSKVEIMELFIKNAFFIKNAKGWGQLNYHEFGNPIHFIDMWLKLIGEIAFRAYNMYQPAAITLELIPRKKDRPILELSTEQLKKDYDLYEFLKEKAKQEDYIGFRVRLAVNFSQMDEHGRPIVLVNMPQEEQEDDSLQQRPGRPRNVFSVKLCPAASLGEWVVRITDDNTKQMNLERKKSIHPKFLVKKTVLSEMDMNKYRRMVCALTGIPFKVDDATSNCTVSDSLWNPVNAFAAVKDSIQVYNLGGDKKCCNGDYYETWKRNNERELERVYTFPYPKNVYRISVHSFLPEQQAHRFFPHVPKPLHLINHELKSYLDVAYDIDMLKMLTDEEKNCIKIGLPSARQAHKAMNANSDDQVRQIMNCINGDPMAQERERIKRIAEKKRRRIRVKQEEGVRRPDSDIDEDDDDNNRPSNAVIEGIDMVPSVEQSRETYELLVMEKQSGAIPDHDIDHFEKESNAIWNKDVNCHKKEIDNPLYVQAVEDILTKYNLPSVAAAERLENQKVRQRIMNHLEAITAPQKIINPEWIEARHMFLIKRFIDFETNIWHEDASIPDSVKAICIWERKHLKDSEGMTNNKNFSMPQKKQTSNLTPFGDMIMARMAQLDTVEETFTTHASILLTNVAALQIFFPSTFHAHILYAGPPKTGKSRVEKYASKNQIEGTYLFLTYESLKAKTGSGTYSPFQHSQRVEYYEDIMPSVVGVGTIGEGADNVAFLKNVLTAGEITYSVLVMGPDGTRINETKTVKVNNLFVAATNALFFQMPASIISRFIAITVQNDERPERGGPTAKVSEENSVRKYAASEAEKRWHRDQCFIAKTAYFIKGISCMLQMNTDAARAVFGLIAEVAIKEPYCLRGFDDVRKIEQLTFLTQALAGLNANYIVFDSEISQIKDQEYHPTHFLQLIPYWSTTVEQAVFALGLMEHQFEDQIAQNTRDALITNVFSNKAFAPKEADEKKNTKNNNYNSLDIDEGVAALNSWSSAELKTDNLYTYVNMNQLGISSYRKSDNGNSSRAESSDALLNKLAYMLQTKMHPTPQVGDIKNVLVELTRTMVDKKVAEHDRRTNQLKEVSRRIPVMEVDTMDNEIKILNSFLKQGKKRLLKQCIEQRLSHQAAEEATYLYGAAIDKQPNLLDVVKIKPNNNSDPLYIINPDYFSKEIQRLTIESLEGVSQNLCGEPIQINWNDMFASSRKTHINSDLDKFFNYQYNHKMTFLKEEIGTYEPLDLPNNNPKAVAHRIMEAREKTKVLKKYPEDYFIDEKYGSEYNSTMDIVEEKYELQFKQGVVKAAPSRIKKAAKRKQDRNKEEKENIERAKSHRKEREKDTRIREEIEAAHTEELDHAMLLF